MLEDSLHSSTLTSNHLLGMILLDLFGGEASIVFPTPRFPPSGNTSAGSSLPKIYGILSMTGHLCVSVRPYQWSPSIIGYLWPVTSIFGTFVGSANLVRNLSAASNSLFLLAYNQHCSRRLRPTPFNPIPDLGPSKSGWLCLTKIVKYEDFSRQKSCLATAY